MDNLKEIEVELKFPLDNKEKLIEKLKQIAEFKKEDFQKDTYYIPEHRNFLDKEPISEWLRLRETEKRFSLNYKNWHNEKETISCDEFQTKIENPETLKKIFKKLDLKEIIEVNKKRQSWFYKNVIISIDYVNELGNFIELEAKGSFKDIEEAKNHLYTILKELNAEVGEQDFKGYPYNLLKKKGLI